MKVLLKTTASHALCSLPCLQLNANADSVEYASVAPPTGFNASPGDSRSAHTPSSRCPGQSPQAPPPRCSDLWPSCCQHLSDLRTTNQQRVPL